MSTADTPRDYVVRFLPDCPETGAEYAHPSRRETATAFVTTFPCSQCFHALINAGIVRIVYGSPYEDRAGDIVKPEAAPLGLPLDELLGVIEVPAPTAR